MINTWPRADGSKTNHFCYTMSQRIYANVVKLRIGLEKGQVSWDEVRTRSVDAVSPSKQWTDSIKQHFNFKTLVDYLSIRERYL
jgi:hypothetical protein